MKFWDRLGNLPVFAISDLCPLWDMLPHILSPNSSAWGHFNSLLTFDLIFIRAVALFRPSCFLGALLCACAHTVSHTLLPFLCLRVLLMVVSPTCQGSSPVHYAQACLNGSCSASSSPAPLGIYLYFYFSFYWGLEG